MVSSDPFFSSHGCLTHGSMSTNSTFDVAWSLPKTIQTQTFYFKILNSCTHYTCVPLPQPLRGRTNAQTLSLFVAFSPVYGLWRLIIFYRARPQVYQVRCVGEKSGSEWKRFPWLRNAFGIPKQTLRRYIRCFAISYNLTWYNSRNTLERVRWLFSGLFLHLRKGTL